MNTDTSSGWILKVDVCGAIW